MKRMLAVFSFIALILTLAAIPAAAQSNDERGIEVNFGYGRGNVSSDNMHLKAGKAILGGLEVPIFQGEKLALSMSTDISYLSTSPLVTNFGNISASQINAGGGMRVYYWTKRRFRPFGGFTQGLTENKLTVGSQSQSRYAYGMGIYGGFKFDIGKHFAFGPLAGYNFASSYGYDQYGNIKRQGSRGSYLTLVGTWRF